MSELLLLAALLVVPNLRLTPGVARPLTRDQVCSVKWGKDARHVTIAMRRQVFAAYGIAWADRARYEVDHLISRELGGADAVANLWPQPWIGDWNAHQKDQLENRLHVLVCSGELALEDAQRAIREDWRAAFRVYIIGRRVPP